MIKTGRQTSASGASAPGVITSEGGTPEGRIILVK
nr:MAG TPA: hypothetical protein [Bacteriophage sp.]DAY34912.1 MAG TPA: hypothetical protein [Bacteriophage sp.]